MPRRLVEEEVDGHVEIEFLQGAGDEGVVGQRHLGIEAQRQQTADFAAVDLAKDLVGVHTGVGQFLGIDAPDTGDVGAVFGVFDVAHTGKLVALLAVFAAALAVGLSGDGAVAAALAADAPGGQYHVDRPEHVLHALAVMLDAASVHQKTGFGGAPPLGGLANGRLADAGHFGGAPRRPLLDVFGHLVETAGVIADEGVIEPVVLDHQMKDAVEQGHVATGLDGQIQVAGAGQRGDARIHHDDAGTVLARLPDIAGGDGAHSATLAPLIQTTSALGMSAQELAARSMPKAFLLPAPAETMHSRPL